MIFDEKLIRETVSGIVDITVEHGYFCFHRYSESQTRYYEAANWDYYRKTYATAGVRFDFVTDATEFSFDYELHYASSRLFYTFDVFVDGKLFSSIGEDKPSSMDSRFEVKLPAGEKRFTLWFPCMYAVFVKNVEADGTFVRPVTYPKTLLAIGDSITHGYDARNPSNAYPSIIAREFDINVINQGIGGDVYHEGNLGDGIGFMPDFVTVLLGTNDWSGRKHDHFMSSLENYYLLLDDLYPEVPKAVITPIWRGDERRITSVGKFKDVGGIISREVRKYRSATVIDGTKMIDHKAELFSHDLLHPNDSGFVNLASKLCPEIKRIFAL